MAAGSYNVQDCDVSTDHTSILVECTFAINSTAPGIVVIQDDQSQYTINKTLQRLQQDSDKGSVNITGLPAGEYSVRVYDNMEDKLDNMEDNSPAYEHSLLLQIVPLSPLTPSRSTNATGTIMLFLPSVLTVYNLFYRHIHCCEFFCAYHSTQQCLSFHNTYCSMYVYITSV